MLTQDAEARPAALRTFAIAARPTLLFAVAYALNTTPHEAVHALTAYLLGFNSTIFQMWVNPEPAAATPAQLAAIAAAGPIFSLTAGAACLLLYAWRFRLRPSGLLFFMLALVGILCFLGPMAGAAFGGDSHTALGFLGVPEGMMLALSAAGWMLLAAFTFLMGRELAGWMPAGYGRAASVSASALAPVFAGTALILILYWPLPQSLVGSILAGALFWVPIAIGIGFASGRPRPARVLSAFTWADATVSAAAIVMIRVFAMGIRLAH